MRRLLTVSAALPGIWFITRLGEVDLNVALGGIPVTQAACQSRSFPSFYPLDCSVWRKKKILLGMALTA
ncbi:hypothetical protein DQ400_00060 [Vreelandella sulfidaeris]|uniref:Uncharacterized protein n=1 Tax=Vreelandella sulfidaeris TaxID=115553 RepID=A0A365TST1_9GAMM|nr:hypothetical protein DQ400_00060 [Halomonas sulfidaeris]